MLDFLVFIGRFQPFHIAHRHVIREALQRAREVIVLIGSSRQPRSLRNPFTLEERVAMIRASLTPEESARARLLPLEDSLYNDAVWVKNVRDAVQRVLDHHAHSAQASARIGLIGHLKDDTSYYLKIFPEWSVVSLDNHRSISATPLRQAYLLGETVPPEVFPPETEQFLVSFRNTPAYEELHQEALFIRRFKDSWATAPYPPIFVTVDALVVQNGHVLLVERDRRPGQGLWALPGGFLDPDESLFRACLRELREETCLSVPESVLQASFRGSRAFDDPQRSARGRTITHAFHFALPDSDMLPVVEGADDARTARWTPLSEITPERMFEDHYHIIRCLLDGD